MLDRLCARVSWISPARRSRSASTPAGVVGGGQVGAGGAQLVDQPPALLALPVEGLVTEHGGDGDGRAEGRSDDRGGVEAVLVPGEAEDGGRRGQCHGGEPRAAPEQVQLEEGQREGEPDAVLGQCQQHQPGRGQRAEPEGRTGPRAADGAEQQAGRVDGAHREGGGGDGRLPGAVDGGAGDGQREQAGHQQVQTDPEHGGDGGE